MVKQNWIWPAGYQLSVHWGPSVVLCWSRELKELPRMGEKARTKKGIQSFPFPFLVFGSLTELWGHEFNLSSAGVTGLSGSQLSKKGFKWVMW